MKNNTLFRKKIPTFLDCKTFDNIYSSFFMMRILSSFILRGLLLFSISASCKGVGNDSKILTQENSIQSNKANGITTSRKLTNIECRLLVKLTTYTTIGDKRSGTGASNHHSKSLECDFVGGTWIPFPSSMCQHRWMK